MDIFVNENRLKIVLFIIIFYSFSFTLLKTFFSIENLKKTIKSDYIAVNLYFLIFFILLLFLPISLIFIFTFEGFKSQSFSKADILVLYLKELFNFKIGNYKTGILITISSLPLIILLQKNQNNELANFYPFSKEILKNKKKFIINQFLYFFLYYTAWEFTFRGFFQNFILFSFDYSNINLYSNNSLNIITNYSIYILFISITIQTIISTLFHIGHPKIEIFASFIGGYIFGFLTYITSSIIYNILIHAFLGITTDYFIFKNKN
jgi:hypothetical protein